MAVVDLRHARIAITGGSGFLGRAVVRALRAQGVNIDAIFALSHNAFDLRDKAAVRAMYETLRPTVVLHLAAVVGGIGANRENPGRFFYENLIMGAEVIEEGRRYGRLDRLLVVGTVCAYPKFTPAPFREESLWDGYPEETNAPYGVAKRVLAEQLRAYNAQYGLPGAFVVPVNLYGPEDNFDLQTSHVIPALIRKVEEARIAGHDVVEVWGDGTPTREFLYVDDAARGIVAAAAALDDPAPVNLGTGREIAIRDLAVLIGQRAGYSGSFRFDVTAPNGQPRRVLDVSRAEALLGFKSTVDLEEGLDRTIAWWRQAAAAANRLNS